MNRIFDGQTGKIVEPETFDQRYGAYDFEPPPWTFGNLQDTVPNAPAIADFFGVPVKWIVIAGVVIWVGSYFVQKTKG
jgi:hypothetical protein